VVYKGAATRLEHVVEPGTTNRLQDLLLQRRQLLFDGRGGQRHQCGSYAAYEKVNPFSYTNDTAFGTSMVGGQGFGANYWVANSGTWKARTNNAWR
jgi:hypothetical protein